MTAKTPGGAAEAEDRGAGLGLGDRFHRGLMISLLNTTISRMGMFLLGVVLARLLVPEAFGIYATALVVQNMLIMVGDIGSAAAIVRRRGPVAPLLPTAWTLSLIGGMLSCGIGVALAPQLAGAFGVSAATGVLQLMAGRLLLDGLASVPAGMLARDLLQGRRLVADVSGMAVNIGVTASLALGGAGPWSLAIGNVGGTVVTLGMLVALSRQWPRFGFERSHAGEIIRYGSAMAGSAFLLVALQGTPQLVTGAVLGVTALGYFFIASNVANWPVTVISTSLERVALATFSRVAELGADVSQAASRMIGLIGGVVLTVGGALAVLAAPLIEVVYGRTWLPAAGALSGLALATVGRVVSELVMNVLLAAGSTLGAVIPQVCWLTVLIPSTVLGGHYWGITGVGWAQAAAAALVALPLHLWFLRRAGVSLRTLSRGCALPLALAAATVLTLLGIRQISASSILILAVGGAITACAVLAGYLRLRRDTMAAMVAPTAGAGAPDLA
ncbi:MAG: oligosaccharide flippase family protein [Pseudonocardiaceae bacterium]